MRKLINSTYISLDGFIEDPSFTMSYFAEEAAEVAGGITASADALIMGRGTYEGFAATWPNMDESDPNTGAAYFNSVKKWVASTTLTNPEWNNTEVIQGDVVEAVRALKAAEGGDIVQYGYGALTNTLVKAGLVDEVKLWIHPVLVGKPNLTTALADAAATFELLDTRVFKNGVIVATYRPQTAA